MNHTTQENQHTACKENLWFGSDTVKKEVNTVQIRNKVLLNKGKKLRKHRKKVTNMKLNC